MTRSFRIATSLVVAGLLLAACSSSGSSTTTTTSHPTTSSTTTTTVSAATVEPEIRHAFSVLFNLSDPAIEPKLAVVQDGATLRQAIGDALKSTLAKAAGGAKVTSIKLKSGTACSAETLTSPCAAVVFDILSTSGSVLLPNSKGYSIEQGGHWVVTKTTICSLLTLANGGTAPKGC